MTVIESEIVINKSVSEVYNFLSDFNNHQVLMPENIYNWSSTKDEAQFSIQNMAKLSLKISSRVPETEIVVIPSDEAPFDVELKWLFKDNNDGNTTAHHIISADLNMMMKMLAVGPLQKLADHQTQSLKKKLG